MKYDFGHITTSAGEYTTQRGTTVAISSDFFVFYGFFVVKLRNIYRTEGYYYYIANIL